VLGFAELFGHIGFVAPTATEVDAYPLQRDRGPVRGKATVLRPILRFGALVHLQVGKSPRLIL
jgi:hypothetical protein